MSCVALDPPPPHHFSFVSAEGQAEHHKQSQRISEIGALGFAWFQSSDSTWFFFLFTQLAIFLYFFYTANFQPTTCEAEYFFILNRKTEHSRVNFQGSQVQPSKISEEKIAE